MNVKDVKDEEFYTLLTQLGANNFMDLEDTEWGLNGPDLLFIGNDVLIAKGGSKEIRGRMGEVLFIQFYKGSHPNLIATFMEALITTELPYIIDEAFFFTEDGTFMVEEKAHS